MIDEIILGLVNRGALEEENIQLIETYLFDGAIIVNMPEAFEELSDEQMKERYTVEPRPGVIYSDESGRINFVFNLLDEKIPDLNLYALKIRESIKMVYPNTLFYDEDFVVNQDNDSIQYFDFRSSSLEGPIYNNMYLVQLTDRTLLGAFNCPFEDYINWKSVVKEVINSIRI